QDAVGREAAEPRHERLRGVILGKIAEQAEEDFLGGILGVGRVPREPVRDVVDEFLDGFEDASERFTVAHSRAKQSVSRDVRRHPDPDYSRWISPGFSIPRSVMNAVMYRAGVTSNAGFQAGKRSET